MDISTLGAGNLWVANLFNLHTVCTGGVGGGGGRPLYLYRTILPENRSTVNKFMADICVAVYALAIDPVSKKHYLLGGFSFLDS